MRVPLKSFVFLLLFFQSLAAQRLSDFSIRLENSFLKLYENPETALQTAKQLRTEEKQLQTRSILAKAYLLKGDYQQSVHAVFENSGELPKESDLLWALILGRTFFHLNLYQQTAATLQPFLENTSSEKEQLVVSQLYQLLAKNAIAQKKFPEAKNYLEKSADLAKDSTAFSRIILQENRLLLGSIFFETSQINYAKNIAQDLQRELKVSKFVYLKARVNLLQGKIASSEKKYDYAISVLEDGLAILGDADFLPLKTEIQKELLKNFLATGNTENYRVLTNKNSKETELLESNKKGARRDLVQLRSERNLLINENTKKQQNLKLIFIIITISLLPVAAIVFYARENQKAKILSKQIAFFRKWHRITPTEVQEKPAPKKPLFIPEETEKELLRQLEDFEQSGNFLDKNMSLATLAGQLETNTKYLSEIINKYKDKNFNTYINELRVNHVVELLSTDSSYLQYKISYIAEIGGFTSHSTFTNVFKSITGMSPNEFMQTLKN